MKPGALLAGAAVAALAASGCSNSESPTEPATTATLRVETLLEKPCATPPPAVAVFVDGVQAASIPIPGQQDFTVSIGTHRVSLATLERSTEVQVDARGGSFCEVFGCVVGPPALPTFDQ